MAEQVDDMFEHFREAGMKAPPPPPDAYLPEGRPTGAPPAAPEPPVHNIAMPPHVHRAPPPPPYRNQKDPYAHMGDIDNLTQMKQYILYNLRITNNLLRNKQRTA